MSAYVSFMDKFWSKYVFFTEVINVNRYSFWLDKSTSRFISFVFIGVEIIFSCSTLWPILVTFLIFLLLYFDCVFIRSLLIFLYPTWVSHSDNHALFSIKLDYKLNLSFCGIEVTFILLYGLSTFLRVERIFRISYYFKLLIFYICYIQFIEAPSRWTVYMCPELSLNFEHCDPTKFLHIFTFIK